MTSNPFGNAALFLVQTLFDFYILVVMLRLVVQFFSVNYLNPMVQVLVRLTNPVVTPLQRLLPSVYGIDLAIVLLLLLLEFIKITLVAWLTMGIAPHHFGVLLWGLGALCNKMLNIFFYAIIVRMLMSWILPGPIGPISMLVHQLTTPLLNAARHLIRPVGGFDWSPLVVLVSLQMISFLLFMPLMQTGMQMAMEH